MEVSLLLCSDYATVSKDNKLSVMGIFSRLYIQRFPGKHPQMFLVMQLQARPAEYGRKFKLGIRLIDQDAIRQLVKLDVNLTIPQLTGISHAEINHVMRLNNIEFPESGTYEFSIMIDNDIKGSLPIEVLELPARFQKGTPASSDMPEVPDSNPDNNDETGDGDFI